MEQKLPRWSYVKVYLNREELEMLNKLCGITPMSEYFRGLLRKEFNKNPK